MIIQCTNCKAKFRVPDARIKKDVARVRCAKCEQIFIAKVGENAFHEDQPFTKPQAFGVTGEERESSVGKIPKEQASPLLEYPKSPPFDKSDLGLSEEKSIKDLISEELKDSGKKPAQVALTQKENFLSDEFPDSDTAGFPKDKVLESSLKAGAPSPLIEKETLSKQPVGRIELKKIAVGKGAQAKKSYALNKRIYFLYPTVLGLAFIGGLIFIGLSFPFKNISLLTAKVPHSIKSGLTITEVNSDYINTATGEILFIISGKIYNNSRVPNAFITLEGELYSTNNLFIIKEKFPCCLSFSKLALHEISNLDSIHLLYEKDRVAELKPYRSFPFALVFKKPEELVKSFRINILNE